MPNIGLPVTQPHPPPGSQSPSHHLALLPGASPGDGCVVTDEVEGQDRNEGQSGVPEDKIRLQASLRQLGRGWAPDFWIPRSQ